MSQLKAKQLKFAAAGDLLIGGSGGSGTTISATGNNDKVLRVVNGAPAWSVNDHLVSPNGLNTATLTDTDGFVVAVANETGDAPVTLATFKNGSVSDEKFVFSSETGKLTIAAEGTEDDIDVIIAAKGNGDVIIGHSGGGIIQADDNEDLALFGGEGTGNLLINGGGTGKVYYGNDSSDPDKEVATVGQITGASRTQTRDEFAGDSTFTLKPKAIAESVLAHVNGLILRSNQYTVNSSTKEVTFQNLPYALDSIDEVIFTYEITA